MDTNLSIYVRLSLQRALLGEITSSMRAVAVAVTPETIKIRVYTEGDASECIREEFDGSVVSQVLGDFPSPEFGSLNVACEFVRCDEPDKLPDWGILVFARA